MLKSKNTMDKLSALAILTLAFLTAGGSAHAAIFDMTRIDGDLHIGDTVQVPVYINPQNDQVSVIGLHLRFSREILWAKSFTFSPGWVAVPGEDYNFIDNGRGVLLGTAGFGDHIVSRTLLGTLEFIAIGDGTTELQADSDSFILDPQNQAILQNSPSVAITVAQTTTSSPLQLFDIKADLERSILQTLNELVARVTFENFGKIPTPVDIEFLVTDSNQRIVDSLSGNTIVETEAVFTQRFDKLILPAGDYMIHVSTRYNANIEDHFDLPFSVKPEKQTFWRAGALLALILCAALLVWRREKVGLLIIKLKKYVSEK